MRCPRPKGEVRALRLRLSRITQPPATVPEEIGGDPSGPHGGFLVDIVGPGTVCPVTADRQESSQERGVLVTLIVVSTWGVRLPVGRSLP